MKFIQSNLKGAFQVELDRIGDDRGFFARSFCVDEFHDLGLETGFVQQNISESKKLYTLRGMHYQVGESAETKYIRYHIGEILDVIIDLRRNSPTFMRHETFELSADNQRALYVPRGFAHGFITLTDHVVVSYLVSSRYSQKNERGIRWNDPCFNISWPTNNPNLSKKDDEHADFDPTISCLDKNFLEC